jgi:hypothetical protein
VFFERSGWNRQPSGLDVVRRLAEEHRALHDLGAYLFELLPRLCAAHEIVGIAPITYLTQDANRLGHSESTAFGQDGEHALVQIDRFFDDPLVEHGLRKEETVFEARHLATGYTTIPPMAPGMGVFETVTRIVQLGGTPKTAARVAEMRAQFEARTGAFAPEDPWFEERSRAFWSDAVTRMRFGRDVEANLTVEEGVWLPPLERAHRGLFHAERNVLIDAWSGAELTPELVDEASQAELDAAAGQLFDARVIGMDGPCVIALLPGAVFHPRQATAAIDPVLTAARAASLSTDDALDALLRMERRLRSLSRVKAEYAYRPEALFTGNATSMRRSAKAPT